MSDRGFPSLTALLGLLAVAGYQNRDKIAEMLRHATSGGGQAAPGTGQQGGLGGLLGQLGGGAGAGAGAGGQQGGLGGLLGQLGGAGAAGGLGGLLGGGLSELLERFQQNGQGDVADSWVSSGPNKEVAPNQLETAIGPDILDTLTQQTGLSREELLSRLSQNLPQAVDRYTPQGRLPTLDELSRG
jgi:uncharacterized protein YidB (DUF937 family)